MADVIERLTADDFAEAMAVMEYSFGFGTTQGVSDASSGDLPSD